jgi:hypothetical protein
MFGKRQEIRVLGHFGEAAGVMAEDGGYLRPVDTADLGKGKSVDVSLGGTKFVLIDTTTNPELEAKSQKERDVLILRDVKGKNVFLHENGSIGIHPHAKFGRGISFPELH